MIREADCQTAPHGVTVDRLFADVQTLLRSDPQKLLKGRSDLACGQGTDSEAAAAIADIRELARGVHPAILTESGLGAALGSLAERAPLPVVVTDELDRRLPPSVEATAYFVAAEAVTNAIKHAGATRVDLRTWLADDMLHLDVHDDGHGGADARNGTGLTGIHDRVAALGGSVRVDSRDGAGTRVEVSLPCASP